MKYKMLREDAHSREAEICRKRPRSARECAKAHSFSCNRKFLGIPYYTKVTFFILVKNT